MARRLVHVMAVFASRDAAEAEREQRESERQASVAERQRQARWAAAGNGRR